MSSEGRFLKRSLVIVALATAACFSPGLVSAQNVGESDVETSGREMTALSSSIDRLTRVLEAQTKDREQDMLYEKLNLAIAYLNFRSRRIEALEQDVQSTRNAKAQIESTLNIWLQRQEEMLDTEDLITDEEARQRSEEIRMRIDLVKQRISLFDEEIVKLENKIYELQGQIDSVEEFVQKNLAL